MQNHIFYIYIEYMTCKHIFLLKDKIVLFQTIQFSITLNGSKYGYVSLTIQLNIIYLFTHS